MPDYLDEIISNLRADDTVEFSTFNGNLRFQEIDKRGTLFFKHILYAPLSEDNLSSLEDQIGRLLPDDLKMFLTRCNGASFYYGSLQISGYDGVDNIKPISLRYGTVVDRPMINGQFADNSNEVRFGGYRFDEIDLMMYLDRPTVYAVKRFAPGPIYYEWASLAKMMIDEVDRMRLMEKRGIKADSRRSFPPSWISSRENGTEGSTHDQQ